MNHYRVTYLDGHSETALLSHQGVRAAIQLGYKVEPVRSIGYSR